MIMCEYVVLPLWLHQSRDTPLVTSGSWIAGSLICSNNVGCDGGLDCWVGWVKCTSLNAVGAEGS